MACKFKYGDKVKVGNHTGTIVSVIKDHIHYVCKVRFDNRFLIPQEMEYEECLIQMIEPAITSGEVKCTCGTSITYGKIPVENHKYYCDLVKEKEKRENQTKWEEDDLLKQFELMLGTDDDDDDDDFGFYIP